MTHPILILSDLKKSFGATEIIRGVNLSVLDNERHAIIGPNGAGKSTLFHLISGNILPTSGDVSLNGESITGKSPQAINRMGLARSFQITNIFPRLSVFENIRLAVMRAHGLQYCFWRFISANRRVQTQSEQLLEQVRLTARAQTIAGEMSYSEQRSLEIAMTLASDPKVILLDEPMAGMSKEEAAYTTELIKEVTTGRALLIVEHDMEVVFSLSDRVSVLVYGEIIATGTPDEVRRDAGVKEAYLGEEVTA
ncbi:ABC transporter ATP-binding protein [Alcaligenaceae bacterium]|nr:ABC transporter ATP-binding protein [Alcaligenaceae bacterium]